MQRMPVKRLIMPVFLSSTLFLTACNTAFVPTGIGVNPCLEAQWQGSKYCGTPTKTLNVELVRKQQLFLADPNEYLDAWVGTKLPLHATAFFKDRIVPPNSYVEFYSNGKLLTRGDLDIPALNGSFSPGFTGVWLDANGIPPGTYPIVAILKNPAGEALAQSNEIQITIPEQPGANAIAWLNPPNDVLSEAGPHIPLRAGVHLLPEAKDGAYVEFYREGSLLGQGQLSPEGDYTLDMNTAGLAPGVYPLKAVLKSAQGETLAETDFNNLIIQDRRHASVGLINLDGKDVLQMGDLLHLDAVVDLRLPVIYSGTKLELLANGQPVGKAFVTKDGNYLLDWNTGSQPPGDYQLEVVVRDNQGREMARSEKLKVVIEGSLPQAGGSLGSNALALSAPSDSVFPGVKVPLKANLNVPADKIPQGAYVEFIQNGKVIGKGIQLPDGSFEMAWDTTGMPPGDYPVQAVLKTQGGQVLAESPMQTVRLDASSQNRIDLTSGNVTTQPGSNVALNAMVNANPVEIQNGAYVEFYQGQDLLGRGQIQPGGTYLYNWDTQGKPTGEYPVQAVLKSGIGATLAESTLATVTLTDSTQNSIDLLTTEVHVKPGNEALLQARPTVSAVELKKGITVEFWQNKAFLGTGTRQSDGTYVFGWDTKGLGLGSYPVKALLKSKAGATLAQSLNGKVILEESGSNLVTLTAPANNTSASVGSKLALKATVDLTPAQKEQGYYVEFYYGKYLIAKGTPQSDGSYLATWDTGDLNPIPYLVHAVLKEPAGKELAQSEEAKVQLSRSNSGGGGGGSSSGNQSANQNGLSLTDPFGVTAIPTEIIPLKAIATFSSVTSQANPKVEFFVDSVKVGEGTKQGGTSTYLFNWDSTGKSLGSHTVTARSVTENNDVIKVSEVGDLNLIQNSVTMNQPTAGFEEVVGENVTLQATPVLSDQQKGHEAIEFYLGDPASGGIKLGDGTKMPDDSFTYTWGTAGQAAASKDLYARLKDSRTDTVLADSPLRQMVLLSNAVDVEMPDNGMVAGIGSQIAVKALVTTTQGIINGGAYIQFYDNGAPVGGHITTFTSTGTPNQYRIVLDDPAASPSPIVNYDTTSLSGNHGFSARLFAGTGILLEVADAHQVDFINSDIQLILPDDKQVNLIGDSVVLQASVDVLPADSALPKRVDFYVNDVGGTPRLVGQVYTGNAINGDPNRRSFTLDWTASGAERTAPVTARYYVDEGSGYVQRGGDAPSRDLVLINNSITWIKTPSSLDILPGDTLGVGSIDNATPSTLDPDDFIVELKLKPSQVQQIHDGTLKLGIDVDGDNVPDTKVFMLDVDGNTTNDPIAGPGDTIDHGSGSTTLTPGFYRYRLRWTAVLSGPENDGDNTNNVGDNRILKAELRNGLGNLAVSGNTGSVNIKSGNVVSLDTIDTVNTKDGVTVGGKPPIGTVGTPVNILAGDSTVTLSATPVLSSAQRGVAVITFYKKVNGGGQTQIDQQTTNSNATYTTPAFTVSESNGDDIEYSVVVSNLKDNFNNPLSDISESDFAHVVDFGITLNTPATNAELNDGSNSKQDLQATPVLPHKYDNTYGPGKARVRFTLEGDGDDGDDGTVLSGVPVDLLTDTTINNNNNGASLTGNNGWQIDFTGIEDTNVGPNNMNLTAVLEVDQGAGFAAQANDTHVVTSRNHNVDLKNIIAFRHSDDTDFVTLNNNDDTLYDNDAIGANETETIRVTGTVTADAPPEIATVRLMDKVGGSETEVGNKVYTVPGDYSFDYVPSNGSTSGIRHTFRIVIKDASGNELDTTNTQNVDVIKNSAAISGLNDGGIYQSGRDSQAVAGNLDEIQDKVTLSTNLKLSKLQLSKTLDVTFELEGVTVETVPDPGASTTYTGSQQTFNGLSPFDPGDDKTAKAIIKEGGVTIFESSTKDINLVDPEITMYAIRKGTNIIDRIVSRTGTTTTPGATYISDGDASPYDSFGIAKDPTDGSVYFATKFDINNTVSNRLIHWDPKAGDKSLGSTAYSQVAQLSTGASSTARLSFNQNTDGINPGGTLYLSLSSFSGLEFYRVNKSTGSLTSITVNVSGGDPSSFTNIEGDIAFDTDGTLYLAHGADLYRSQAVVSDSTSSITLELMPGYTPTDNIFGISIDEASADAATSRLLLVRKVGTGDAELVAIDKSTGGSSLIKSLSGSQYTDITSSHNIP